LLVVKCLRGGEARKAEKGKKRKVRWEEQILYETEIV